MPPSGISVAEPVFRAEPHDTTRHINEYVSLDAEMGFITDHFTVMAALRDPVRGCPWDHEQRFETIAPYTIEEAYEVAEAITRGDEAALADEEGTALKQAMQSFPGGT